MKNIQTAISPLLTVLCVCGYGVFEYPQNQLRFCLTFFYVLISWMPYVYIVFKMKIVLDKLELDYPVFVYTHMIFAILYILSNMYYNKQFKSCLEKLNIVSNTLEKLGTPKNYAILKIQIICIIIGWITLAFLANVNDYLWYYKHMPKSYIIITICAPCIANYPLQLNTLYDFKYMMLLRYVGLQFGLVNKYIQEVTEHKKHRVRYAWTTSSSSLICRHMTDTETCKQNIWILMHVHFEVCSISRELNTIFGLQMVMQAVAFYVFALQLIYESYIAIILHEDFTYDKLLNLFCIYFWINSIKMIIFNYICEKLCVKANRTEKFLNKLIFEQTDLTFDVETYETMKQFLLQILRKPLKISGSGLFYFGFKFLTECANSITNIVICVIQSGKELTILAPEATQITSPS